QLQVQQAAVARGGVDGAIEIELLGRTLARELAQAAQRQLEVARAELDAVIEVAVLAQLPDLHRAALAAGVAPDADAFRVEAPRPEGRGAAATDPLAAALMPPLLLGEPLTQRLHEL